MWLHLVAGNGSTFECWGYTERMSLYCHYQLCFKKYNKQEPDHHILFNVFGQQVYCVDPVHD